GRDSPRNPGRQTRRAVSDRCGNAAPMNGIIGTLVVLVSLAAAGIHAQGTAPAGNAENGKAVFIKAKCFSCHGTVGQGGPGGRLAPQPVAFGAFRRVVPQREGD